MTNEFVVGAGSNLGTRTELLCSGLSGVLAVSGIKLCALSSVFETGALGPPQPDYLNAAMRVESALTAEQLLDRLLSVEAAHGRVRTERWGPRTLDLDILWSNVPVHTERVRVPHPGLAQRTFALAPLLEVAPVLGPRYANTLATLGGAPRRIGVLHAMTHDSGATPRVTFVSSA